jgi:hypothetical protein
MNYKVIPLDYANSLMYELEKAFWDERGKGARFRMMNVGKEFFNAKCLPLLKSADVEEILKTIEHIIQDEGISSKVSYSTEERLLKVSIQGCMHRQIEDTMMSKGIEPFTCIPANIIIMAIEDKLGQPVELAEIKLEEGECQLLLILFDKRPGIE